MANEFIDRLRNTDDVLVYFNAIQTIFTEEYGKPMEEHLSAWIVDHPKEFQDTLQRIYATGHDIFSIGTQAASIFRAKPFGQAIIDRIYELNYTPAKLAKEVTPKGYYAAGLCSTSLQDFLEPLGNITREEVYNGYLEQIKGLVDGGVDVIAIVGDDIEAAVIAILCIIYLLLGCVMEGLALVVVTTPVILPAVMAIGLDPVWWGVLLVVLVEMGLLTPPVGINLFVIQGISGSSLGEVVRGTMPFFFVMLVALVLMIAFPSMVLWLPTLFFGS